MSNSHCHENVCDDVRPWRTFLNLSGHDLVNKVAEQRYIIFLSAVKIIEFWLDSFRIWHKWSLIRESVARNDIFILTFISQGNLVGALLKAMLGYSTLYTLRYITSSIGFWPDLVRFKLSPPLKYIQYFVRCFLILTGVVSCLWNKLFSYFNTGVRRSENPSWNLLVYILGFVLKSDTWGYAYTKHEKFSSRFFCSRDWFIKKWALDLSASHAMTEYP